MSVPPGTPPGIDPDDLRRCLDVIAAAEALPAGHADSLAVQRACAKLFKQARLRRRREARDRVLEHDQAVDARTATAAPGRIDDETAGIALTSGARGASAGTLLRARNCYICKQPFTRVDAFYHQLCEECAAFNHARRDARTDLTGRRALLTGGRAKIGMYIALRLLRDGAHTTITTRFPRDAVRRFRAMDDADEWFDRLSIVGIDLRNPAQVTDLADAVAAEGPLDVLINNAAQTVRRSPDAYALLAQAEAAPLPAGPMPRTLVFGPGVAPHALDAPAPAPAPWTPTPESVVAMALTARSATPERIAAGTAVDAGGLVPDIAHHNSWSQVVDQVDPRELLEVQLCNATAPFILISRLRPALAAAARASRSGRAYVVNVSAMEGQFGRGYKGPGHPHTNMAKAALNMLTRTSAGEMFTGDRILMTAVDTGWITDERPHFTKVRLADAGFHAPLDLVDGAARVYDPIVRGEAGEDVYGCFLKDYQRSPW